MITITVVLIILLVSGVTYGVLFLTKGAPSSSTTSSVSTNPLLIYSADAYANESLALEKGFTSQTGVPAVTSVIAGSSSLAVDISQGDPVSVFISVSRSSVESTGLGPEFPGWAISFAGDEMGIAYTQAVNQTAGGRAVISAYDSAINQNTTASWFQFFNNLTSGSVKIGISNPNTDPAGYRAWIVLELAGIAYSGTGIEQYFVDRLITNGGNVTGASAASLIPALDTGQIQFLFIYKSDIVSEGLNPVQLSGAVSLGSPEENGFYSKANYTTAAGIEKGSAIQLWLSVPKDSTNLNESVNFVAYTVENYEMVLKNFGLVLISPGVLYNDTSYTVPPQIDSLVKSGELAAGGPL